MSEQDNLLRLIELECNVSRIATARLISDGHALERLYDRQRLLTSAGLADAQP